MPSRTKKLVLQHDMFEQPASVLVTAWVPSSDSGTEIPVLVADEKGHSATNPDTGLTAVWLRGEVVPDWAASDEDMAKLNAAREKAAAAAAPEAQD